jgi:hypothetical protein
MSKVFDFETGKKIGDDKIAKLVPDKTSSKPISPEEQEEIMLKAEKMEEKDKTDKASKGGSKIIPPNWHPAEKVIKEVVSKIEENKPENKE